MNVVLYCDDPGHGGTAINAALLVAGLAEKGWGMTLAASRDLAASVVGVQFVSIGYDTQRCHLKTQYSRNEPQSLLLRCRPDLVLFCDANPDSSLAAKTACLEWKIPFVILANYVSADHVVALAGKRTTLARLFNAAQATVAVSTENLTVLRKEFGVSPRLSEVIFNGRPTSFFTSPPPDARQCRRRSLGLGEEDVLCLTVARYEPRKGYQHLLNAAAMLETRGVGARLAYAWIGHALGDAAVDLTDDVARRGLSDRISVLGQREDVREWLAAADIFVLASESEGMPLSITEAMAQGLPVVGTAVSGIPEQVGETGIVVPDPTTDREGTVAALAEGLCVLATDPARRKILGRAARERAASLFSAECMLAAYDALLPTMLPLAPNIRTASWTRSIASSTGKAKCHALPINFT